MPSLRDHSEDIPAMALSMVEEMNTRHGTTVPGIKGDVMERFMDYSWPGNARELRNTIERAVILSGNKTLDASHLPQGFGEESSTPPPHGAHLMYNSAANNAAYAAGLSAGSSSAPAGGHEDMVHLSVGTTVDEAEKQLILKTLNSTRNNKTRAAEILGISSKTLQNKLKEYALDDKEPSS
jgi:DNA-binding NtrC family response regulator